MGNATAKFVTVALTGAMGLFVLGHPAEVRAQTVFCPSTVSLPGGLTPTGITFKNGLCTNVPVPTNGIPTGAFSGAALASQALSELSETTTQETTRNAVKAVSDRREQEKERCAEGFSRVDGTCQRNPPPVSEAAPVVPAGPPEEHALKKTKKTKAAAIRREEAEAAPKIMRRAPPPPMVCKDGPCAPPPIPIEPAIRIGTWTQVYGDYEKRSAVGASSVPISNFNSIIPGATPPPPVGLDLSVQSRTGTVGFLVGADLTSRGVIFENDGLIAGLLTGYVSSDVTLNETSVSRQPATLGNGSAHVNANLAGPTAGLYATYFNGGFSTDLTLKVDALNLNEIFNEAMSFTNPVVANPAIGQPAGLPVTVPFLGGGSTDLLNATVAGNLNYRFDLYPNFWIEPTAGAQYTNSSYRSNAFQLGLADGALVMVQGGARFGASTFINNHILMTATLTGLAYDDVLVAGGFIPVSLFNGVNLLAQADQGKVRGRGILALNFDFGDGISSFVQGEVRGGSGLFGAGGRAGFRVNW